MPVQIHTGTVPGRVVWGHPTKSKPKTRKNPVTGKDEVVLNHEGQPVQQWAFGVAFPKEHFNAAIYPAMYQEALAAFPNGVPPRFAWKIKDGDGIDDKGQPFSKREGYAGCMVLTVSTEAFCPQVFKRNQGGTFDQFPGENMKTGDYIALSLDIKYNNATGNNTPGLYVNPLGIEHVAFGTEIVSTGSFDPNAAFGAVQYQLPAGASAQPVVTPGAVGMPGMQQPMAQPGMQQPMAQPGMQQPMAQPGMQQPGQFAPGQPMASGVSPSNPMPAPAHDFVQTALGQQPMAQPQPGYPMPGQVMPQFPGQ